MYVSQYWKFSSAILHLTEFKIKGEGTEAEDTGNIGKGHTGR